MLCHLMKLMNRIHDMGGREDQRSISLPLNPEKEQMLLGDHWTTKTLAITLAMGFLKVWNLDSMRYCRETLPPQQYMSSSYYKRWLLALEKMIESFEMLSPINIRKFSKNAPAPENVFSLLKKGNSTLRERKEPPAFAVGEEILVKENYDNVFVTGGHMRLPGYIMGKRGKIIMYHKAHVFPDSNAHFKGESPEHLYGVEFVADDLWGASYPNKLDTVSLDLWEPYMEKI